MRLGSVLLLILIAAPDLARAQKDNGQRKSGDMPPGMMIVAKGGSSRSLRKQAVAALPYNRVSPANQQRMQAVVSKTHLFRKLPEIAMQADPAAYNYFVDHPDAAVSIWRVMGISNFKMYQTAAQTFEAAAGDGSYGKTEVIYRGPNEALVLCDGVYKSPLLLKPIKAHCLLHLQNGFYTDQAGRRMARHRVSVFCSFPSRTITTAAKVVSPVTNGIMDRNFVEVSIFLQMMSTAMQQQPGWVQHVAGRMDGVVEQTRTALKVTNATVNQEWQERIAKAQSPQGTGAPAARSVSLPSPPQR